MTERETTRETLDSAAQLLEDAASHINDINDHMRNALHLFAIDPPDTDFQRGYYEALKIFANEALDISISDPRSQS